MSGFDEVRDSLQRSYDAHATERETLAKQDWKLAQRLAFGARMRAAGARRLLEVGAGTGQDSLFFMEEGFEVVATDLSSAMVNFCRAKGIDARVMDLTALTFAPASFDAVYSMNSLLHIPDAQLPAALGGIRSVLRPAGLCYVGVWGGQDFEGVPAWDHQRPRRFFSFRTDEQLQAAGREHFDIVDFHVVKDGDLTFQSLTLRVPG